VLNDSHTMLEQRFNMKHTELHGKPLSMDQSQNSTEPRQLAFDNDRGPIN